MAASRQLGLVWKSHVMREGYGMTVWVLVAFTTDTLHAYWRTAGSFTMLEQVRMVFYLGSLLYWIAAFWIAEHEEQALSPEMMARLEALSARIDYAADDGAPRTDGALSK